MSANTSIEWTATVHPDGTVTKGKTWNPLIGCTRVSAGCRHCYAERVAKRWQAAGVRGYDGVVDRNGRWTGRVNLVESALGEPLRWRKPQRIFVNSMSDLFHPSVSFAWMDSVFRTIGSCKQHTFMVLTKRPDIMADYVVRRLKGSPHEIRGVPLPNLWLGTSIEDQATAGERIPWLLKTPAAVRFVSAEPLLGPVDFRGIAFAHTVCPHCGHADDEHGDYERSVGCQAGDGSEANPICGCRKLRGEPCHNFGDSYAPHRIDWVICGGESGPGARPMHPAWAWSLRDQCAEAGVPFFFKQWGEFCAGCQLPAETDHVDLSKSVWLNELGDAGRTSPCDSDSGDDCIRLYRVGKRAAGRMLDGRTHDAFPAAPEPAV